MPSRVTFLHRHRSRLPGLSLIGCRLPPSRPPAHCLTGTQTTISNHLAFRSRLRLTRLGRCDPPSPHGPRSLGRHPSEVAKPILTNQPVEGQISIRRHRRPCHDARTSQPPLHTGHASRPETGFSWLMVRSLYPDWKRYLILVRPETVVRWHRQGWRLNRRWRSGHQLGRCRLSAEIRS